MISEFAKEKVIWTDKMNLKLVNFMESKPNIWNPKHPKYTSVSSRNKTYAEFAIKYGNAFTGQAVKDRWTNIRSTFASYLRKSNTSRTKGDGEEYKVNWYLWDACQFLRKVSRTTPTNIDNEVEDSKSTSYELIVGNQNETDDEDMQLENNVHESNKSCKRFADDLLIAFRGVQNDVFGLDNTKHGRIGRAVTKKLCELNSYEAARISAKIMEVLMLYDQNNPRNPNNSYNINIYGSNI